MKRLIVLFSVMFMLFSCSTKRGNENNMNIIIDPLEVSLICYGYEVLNDIEVFESSKYLFADSVSGRIEMHMQFDDITKDTLRFKKLIGVEGLRITYPIDTSLYRHEADSCLDYYKRLLSPYLESIYCVKEGNTKNMVTDSRYFIFGFTIKRKGTAKSL